MDNNITSFSTGGNIFAEIASALDGANQSEGSLRYQITAEERQATPVQRTQHSPLEGGDQMRGGGTDSSGYAGDHWMPQVSGDGKIYYFNSRTGQMSEYLPAQDTESSRPVTARSIESSREQASLLNGQQSRDSHTSESAESLTSAFYGNLHRDQSIRRPHHAAKRSSQAQLPDGWVMKVLEDGYTAYYQNLLTGETAWNPPELHESLTSSPSHSTRSRSLSGSQLANPASQLNLAGRRPSLAVASTPNMPQSDASRLSFTSDDSAFDAPLVRKRSTSRKIVRPDSGLGHKESAHSEAGLLFLPQALETLEPPVLPSIGVLQAKAQYTLTELIECAHPRRSAIQHSSNTTGDDPALDLEREELADLTTQVMGDIRSIMHAVGVLGQPAASTSSSRLSLTEVSTRTAQLRPYTKKVTSPLSKLVLSVRAVWGLMGTSYDEEARTQDLILDADTEEDVKILRNHRAEMLTVRIEGEKKLRLDIVVGAREVSDALEAFVNQARTLLPSSQSPLSEGNKAVTQRRLEGILRTNVATLLAPGAGFGANWRGNGLSVLPAHQPHSISGNGPVPNVKYTYPRRLLTEDTISNVANVSQTLQDEINTLRSVLIPFQRIVDKRASDVSWQSQLSEQSGSVAPPLLKSHHPLDGAVRRLNTLVRHSTSLISALSSLLNIVEDIDISLNVDLEVDTESIASLLEYQKSVAQIDAQDTTSTIGNTLKNYQRSLVQARKLLVDMEAAKQLLYDTMANITTNIQSIAIAGASDASAGNQCSLGSRSQPVGNTPLSDFSVFEQRHDPLTSMISSLDQMDRAKRSLEDALKSLFDISGEHAKVPQELRAATVDYRSRISTHRLFQASLASSFRSTVSSNRLALASQTQRSLSIIPLASELTNESSVRAKNTLGESFSAYTDKKQANRISLTDSLISSAMSSDNSQSSLLQYNNKSSGLRLDSTNLQSSPIRSPSTNKIKKFFGDEAPTTSPSRPTTASPKAESKIKRFFGDEAPNKAVDRSALPARVATPAFLLPDHLDEIAITADGTVRGGTLRGLVSRLTPHDTGVYRSSQRSLMLNSLSF